MAVKTPPIPVRKPTVVPKVPFDPLAFLSGGSLPGISGGDAGPAFSDADSGLVTSIASITAPFVVGGGNQVAGGGAPGGAAGGFGALTSSNIVWLVAIVGGAWLILQLRRR